MPWIRTIDRDEAGNELRQVFDRIETARGKLSDIMRVQSLAPRVMAAHLDLYLAIMFDRSGLSREEREAIAVVVSALNGCHYCVDHHSAALRTYWKDDARVRQLATDFVSAELSARMAGMIRYATALTRSPSAVSESEIARLRQLGLDDAQILALNLVVAYFNFVNRIASGLGVEPTPGEVAGYRY